MRRPRIFLDAAAPVGGLLALPDAARRHLGTVLRLRVGAPLLGVTPDGTELDLEWVEAGRVRVTAIRARESPSEPDAAVTLAIAVPRGERMDWIVEKAVEIGVAAIMPLQAERSAPAGQAGPPRLARWERLARSAAEQSGRRRIPPILPASALVPAVRGFDGFCLLAHPTYDGGPPGGAPAPAERQARVLIAIGPEGGWTDGEVAAAQDAGARLLPLGPRILRVETAALVALTLVLSSMGALGGAVPGPGREADA